MEQVLRVEQVHADLSRSTNELFTVTEAAHDHLPARCAIVGREVLKRLDQRDQLIRWRRV